MSFITSTIPGIIPSPASTVDYTPGRPKTCKIQLVVIHVEAGTEAGTISWFANPAAHVSAHYSIGKDGTIHQHVSEVDTAWHAGLRPPYSWNDNTKNLWPGINPNAYSIGIEHEGFDDGQPWPDAQIQSSSRLVADICHRYSIPITRAHVVGHHEIDSQHSCPGRAGPVDQIVALASQIPLSPST